MAEEQQAVKEKKIHADRKTVLEGSTLTEAEAQKLTPITNFEQMLPHPLIGAAGYEGEYVMWTHHEFIERLAFIRHNPQAYA